MRFAVTCLSIFAISAAAIAVRPRTVDELDEAATAEAQQRDSTAVRAFSNIQIKTSDGRCLFVDKLSGDFRENLTPIQVGACGATDGQGWDIITSGKHNNVAGSILVVSTLTQACFNFDPRRAPGNQVLLFSCGGRADGGGEVTNSQLFEFNGGSGPLSFEPENQKGSCLRVNGNVLDIAKCDAGDSGQVFTFGQNAADSNSSGNGNNAQGTATNPEQTTRQTAVTTTTAAPEPESTTTTGDGSASFLTANPTVPVPVSGAGGTLNPTAAAEANQRDDTATRAFSAVEIRAPNGQCLFVDPTAGDFRQNLIPVALVDCGGTPNEKWDIITAGLHNDRPDSALITNGCVVKPTLDN
ncbi:hypothetical protein VTK73DRAFT_5167 [Phialemonium thermophilum]|uniref:Ricin B lectin domain-containing protein n=1 Tax=Phialemonium thermophilum TaxID=223376 RepID=A0ABR3XZ13_9PEZI